MTAVLNPDPDWQQISGFWTAPRLESTSDQTVQMHVSIAVSASGELADEDVDAVLVAGGQELQQVQRPGGEDPLSYLQLRGIAAVGRFAFANPEDLTPEFVNIRVREETVGFSFGDGQLPVA